MKNGYWKRVRLPALILFIAIVVVSTVAGCIRLQGQGIAVTFEAALLIFLPSVVSALLSELFAYITCWAFVLRKDKADNYVWINYLIWVFINCAGFLNMR